MSALTADKVIRLVTDCTLRSDAAEELIATGRKPTVLKGVRITAMAHPDLLEEKKLEIQHLVDQLPDSFDVNGGGGMSFLQACVDKDGRQWGENFHVDYLLALGRATGSMGFCMDDPELWKSMPSGLPYIWAKKSAQC